MNVQRKIQCPECKSMPRFRIYLKRISDGYACPKCNGIFRIPKEYAGLAEIRLVRSGTRGEINGQGETGHPVQV